MHVDTSMRKTIEHAQIFNFANYRTARSQVWSHRLRMGAIGELAEISHVRASERDLGVVARRDSPLLGDHEEYFAWR